MQIKIHKDFWMVYFVPGTDEHLHDSDGDYLGMTFFLDQTIYIRTDMTPEKRRATLIHELTHAFLDSFGVRCDQYDEEQVCNFNGAYLDDILELTEEILRNESHKA